MKTKQCKRCSKDKPNKTSFFAINDDICTAFRKREAYHANKVYVLPFIHPAAEEFIYMRLPI